MTREGREVIATPNSSTPQHNTIIRTHTVNKPVRRRRNPQRASEKVVWPPRPNTGTYGCQGAFLDTGRSYAARMTPGHAKKPFYFKKDDFGLPMRTPHPICAHMCSSTLHLDAKIQFFRFFANLPHLGPPSPAPWSVSEKSIFEHRTMAAILPVHRGDMNHW